MDTKQLLLSKKQIRFAFDQHLLLCKKPALTASVKGNIRAKILPLSLDFLPLTDFMKNNLLFLPLINLFLYFCKKNKASFYMFKVKSLILFFLLFISTNILVSRSYGCEQKNDVLKNGISLNQYFFNQNILSVNSTHKNSSDFMKTINIGNTNSASTAEISSDKSENEPFIDLDFALSNCIPEFKVNEFKYKLGLDNKSLHLFNKHTSSSISILSFNNLHKENLLFFVVSTDSIILFRQIQI